MDKQKLPEEKNDLLERLASLSKEGQGVSIQDFMPILDNLPVNVSLHDWHVITNFVSKQLNFWEAEWLFSWEHSPNTKAQAETEGWKLICKNKLPTSIDLIDRRHDLILLNHSLKRAVDYNESSAFRKFKAKVLSEASFKFDKIGLRWFASYLYATALYPKGTVGRSRK
jgi:hypothetical protein